MFVHTGGAYNERKETWAISLFYIQLILHASIQSCYFVKSKSQNCLINLMDIQKAEVIFVILFYSLDISRFIESKFRVRSK